MKNKIIDSIEQFVISQSDENVLFFGDFVYHFSYDRKAILELFDMFLRLYFRGKTLYIISGNHDWISDTYIFQEAMVSFDLLNKYSKNKIYFITEPVYHEIEGKKCLLLPFNYKLFLNKEKPQVISKQGIEGIVYDLLESKHKNEYFSGFLNYYLLEEFNKTDEEIFVFHHYYIANTDFPGQYSRFKFKDIAISEYFLDNFPQIRFVSGHLHKGFGINKYFCTSSVWATSPLEQNEFKFYYQLNLNTLQAKAYPTDINYYIVYEKTDIKVDSGLALFEASKQITQKDIEDKLKQIWIQCIKNFDNKQFNIDFGEFYFPKLSNISLIIISDEFDYDNTSEFIEKDLLIQLKDIKLKRKVPRLDQLQGLLDTSKKDLQQSISDWKSLLREYLDKKFGDNSDKYIDKLRETGVWK